MLRSNPGDVVLLDDGRISLVVQDASSKERIKCEVVIGGVLKSNKGLNLPGCDVDLPHITDKDREDIEFCSVEEYWYVCKCLRRMLECICVRGLDLYIHIYTHTNPSLRIRRTQLHPIRPRHP